MARWAIWTPVFLLAALAGLLGYRLGRQAVTLTESGAIEVFAARYLQQSGPGARPSDCTAMPGEEAWLVVRCGRRGLYRAYWVSRTGGLIREAGPGPAGTLGIGGTAPRI